MAALAALTASATIAGAVTFAMFSAAGLAFPVGARSLVSVCALVAMCWSAGGRPTRPWQRDVETAQRWLLRDGLSVAVLNGMALGVGFMTRIGYWAWWLLPLYAFQAGDVPTGLAIGAVYAATRTGVSSIVAISANRSGADPLRALGAKRQAVSAAGVVLTVVGAALLLAASVAMDLHK